MFTKLRLGNSGSPRRWLALALGGLASAGLLLSVGATSPTRTPSAMATISRVPSADAPLSEWQDWAAAQRSVMTASGWGKSLGSKLGSDCTVTDLQVMPVVSDGHHGIPAGIVTNAVGGSVRCADQPATDGGSTTFGGSSAATSSDCPVQDAGTSKAIADGVLCVGTYTYQGDPNFIAASYKNTSSVSPYGQVDLGVGGCPGYSDGRYPAGGPGYISPGDTWFVAWGPRNFSNEWSSTWYENGTTSWGSVCAEY